jgi:hypothetical protein
MDDDLTLYLTANSIRILKLYAEHGHDFDALRAAHPEITAKEVAQVTLELTAMGIFGKPASRKSGRAKKSGPVCEYQIKMTLRGSKPPIWRRVVVPGGITLAQLHMVIQTAMGWQDDHLHMFEIQGEHYTGAGAGGYEPEFGNGELDESEFRLCDLIAREKTKFKYEYDFGDDWEHLLVVEKIIDDPKKMKGKVLCLDGKGACPPEDCGGIWGYYQMLDVLAGPSDDEGEEMKESLGESFDPAEFDVNEVNKALAEIF